MIKVAVVGARGKMGKEVVQTVIDNPEMELAAEIDINDDINDVKKADVVVDFTQPAGVLEHVKFYLEAGVKSVIGTTGLSIEQVNELEALSNAKNVGCIIAPNFTIGAILMMQFAQTAAKYFDNAEIIEYHHNQKKDAPSGTAIKTAQMMASVNKNLKAGNCEEEELVKCSRGGNYENIHLHAVRMPGFMASQEVVFGAPGQVFKIRHDSVDRKCYMSGVTLAIKNVFENNKFIYGLENIL